MSLWKDRNFLKLWSGQTVSSFGSQITVFAVPSLAILMLDASALQVGILVALNRIAYPILGMPAGVWVDRLPRRPLMIVCNLVQALVLAAIPVAYLMDQLSLAVMYVVTGLAGIAALLFDLAYRAYLPDLVSTDQLMSGNAKLIASDTAAQISAPGIAGFLVQALRGPLLILADVASFLIAAVMLMFIRGDGRTHPSASRQARVTTFRAELLEGLRFAYRHPQLRPLTMYTGVANLGNAIIASVFLVFAYRVADLTPATAGVVMGLGSLGAFLGTFLAGPLQRRFGIGRTMIGASLLGGAGRFLLVITTAGLAVPFIALSWLSFGVTMSIFNVNQMTIAQAAVPPALRGRADAVTRMVVWGTLPLGALLGGLLAEGVGVTLAIIIGSFIRIGATPLLTRPGIRRVRQLADLAPVAREGERA